MLMTFNQVGPCQKEKGFYHAWQRLVKHDPLFTKTTTYFSTSAKSSNRSNRVRLSKLGVKKNIDNHILRVIYYLYQVGQESCIIGHRHIVMMITY